MEKPLMLIVGDTGSFGPFLVGAAVKAGYRVVGTSRRAVLAERQSLEYKHIEHDITRSPAEALKDIVAQEGLPKTFIYNAGVSLNTPVIATSDEQLNRLMNVNFVAPFLIERELGRYYQKESYQENIEKNRSIVNISSAAIRHDVIIRDDRMLAVYAASKSALASFSVAASKEFIDFGVRLNVLAPTFFTGDPHRLERLATLAMQFANGRNNGMVLE